MIIMTSRTQHHPGDRLLLTISAVAFLAATALGQTVTRGPYLQRGTDDAVIVRSGLNDAEKKKLSEVLLAAGFVAPDVSVYKSVEEELAKE